MPPRSRPSTGAGRCPRVSASVRGSVLAPAVVAAVVLVWTVPAAAQDGASGADRVDTLERRVDELEHELANQKASPAAPAAGEPSALWEQLNQRVHVSGNADLAFLYGEDYSRAPNGRFVIDNARLFVDVDLLGRDETPMPGWLDDASLYVEWDAYRHTSFLNQVGSLYVRLDHLGGVDALNAKLGRMSIPFGYEYTRWSEDRPKNPLIGFSAAAPYGWDEGFELFGSLSSGLVSYQAAVLDGDQAVGVNTSSAPSLAGKLTLSPLSWVHVSGSGYTSGRLGGPNHAVWSALIAASTPLPVLSPNPYDPGSVDSSGYGGAETGVGGVQSVSAWEVDVVLDNARAGVEWLGYGEIQIDGHGEPVERRRLHYGVAEGTLELGTLTPALERLYCAARVSFIGTFDDRLGYLLNVDDDGFNLGFVTKLVEITELGIGAHLTKQLTLKAEYALYDFTLVKGATEDERDDAKGRSYGGVALSAGF